jgi:NADH-ubiquinone oxidoreductase chain 5
MLLSLIVIPLLGSIISGFFGRKVGVTGAELITISCVTVTTILSILLFFEIGFNNTPTLIELFT